LGEDRRSQQLQTRCEGYRRAYSKREPTWFFTEVKSGQRPVWYDGRDRDV